MKKRMKLHIILNSHLDPVWRWRRSQGIDEVLSTARTACNILDDFPETIMTRGESWFYEIVEKCDKSLFERIRKHFDNGRWGIVGGWYIQPDCNLPSREVFLKHAEIGKKYFRNKFGFEVKTGYNVDSFGHSGMLPSFLKECGYENYVFMRPGWNEKVLPSPLFKWESVKGDTVNAFRIEYSYSTYVKNLPNSQQRQIDKALAAANYDVGHMMCFIGVGDHGGGPAREEIQWLLENQNANDDVEIAFSTPDIFFKEAAAAQAELPIIKGELQHHAIGCYSAVSRIKKEFRDSVRLLQYAENFPAPKDENFNIRMEEEWKKVLFASFHDIITGTSTEIAYEDIYEDLGSARSFARNFIEQEIRVKNQQLDDCRNQRIIFDNPTDREFCGWVRFAPWVGFLPHVNVNDFKLYDSNNDPAAMQRVDGDTPPEFDLYMAAYVKVPAFGRSIYRFELAEAPAVYPSFSPQISVTLDKNGISMLEFDGKKFVNCPSVIRVLNDKTDTWSHLTTTYPTASKNIFTLGRNDWKEVFDGDFIDCRRGIMRARGGSCCYDVQTFKRENFVECNLRFNWHDSYKLIKMEFKPAFKIKKRLDGISGGVIERELDGQEYPVTSFISLIGADDQALTFVSDDIYSADVQSDGTLRLTLLRTPQYTDHYPFKRLDKFAITDQGYTDINLRLIPMNSYDQQKVYDAVHELSKPLFFSESTKGVRRIYENNKLKDF